MDVADNNRPVVLKQYCLLKSDTSDNDNDRGRVRASFLREVSALQGHNHPNIVSLEALVSTETSQIAEEQYLLMPYFKNSLDAWWVDREHCVQKLARLSIKVPPANEKDLKKKFLRDFTCVASGILHGLQYLHMNNIVHQDIKPTNIMMDERYGTEKVKPVIVDFDLASNTATSRSHSGVSVVGTEMYQSPEANDPRLRSYACDIFSLGATMISLLFPKDSLILLYQEHTGNQAKFHRAIRDKMRGFGCQETKFGEEFCALRDLVISMVHEDRHERPTAGSALQMKFFSGARRQDRYEYLYYNKTSRLPRYWTTAHGPGASHARVDITRESDICENIQKLINNTWVDRIGGDTRDEEEGTAGFEVVKVERLENPYLWLEFAATRDTISKKHGYLAPDIQEDDDGDQKEKPPKFREKSSLWEDNVKLYPYSETLQRRQCNEVLLFHGTNSEDVIKKICESGIDGRHALRAMFGLGSYFGENSSKADEYTQRNGDGERTFIIARVILGKPLYADRINEKRRIPKVLNLGGGQVEVCDSVIANKSKKDDETRAYTLEKHREFVSFLPSQAYPELIVTYKHVISQQPSD